MTYISPKDLSELVLGRPVGDAKTWETRSVPIKVKADGSPENPNLRVGSVVYVDSQGYAVPFTDPATDFADASPVPYGVVYEIDAKLPGNPTHDITPRDNVVRVTVGGVPVVQKMGDTQITPQVGDMVNPYGGKNSVPTVVEGDTPPLLPTLGVCDGVKTTKGGVTLVAVRLNASPATPGGSFFASPRITTCKVAGDYEVNKNEWVYLVGDQTLASESTTPIVAPASAAGANKHIFGIATESTEEGGKREINVAYYGVSYVPFVYATENNPKLAALKASNGGKLPSVFVNHVKHSNGRVTGVLTTIISVGTIIGMAVDISGKIYRMIKGGSSPAKCVDVKKANTPEFRALLAAEGGTLDIEPDGYQGLFVNTGLMGPSTLTEAPVLLDPVTRDKNGNMLIREGRIYAGSIEGVKEISRSSSANVAGTSFYGVSAPSCTEDEEVNPLTNDGEPRIRVIREGVANVEANGDWNQGDYIDYQGKAVPIDEEEFVPHIGKALEATASGELGPVDIRPFNPNQYIVVDYCNDSAKDIPLNTSVYVDYKGIHSKFGSITSDITAGFPTPRTDTLRPDNGVVGVLVRFDHQFWYSTGAYGSRAIIQVSGYMKAYYSNDNPVPNMKHLAAGGRVNWLYSRNVYAYDLTTIESGATGYVDFIGRMMIPNNSHAETLLDVWLLIEPRTEYLNLGAANGLKFDAAKKQE